jgi:hypothetical protein
VIKRELAEKSAKSTTLADRLELLAFAMLSHAFRAVVFWGGYVNLSLVAAVYCLSFHDVCLT